MTQIHIYLIYVFVCVVGNFVKPIKFIYHTAFINRPSNGNSNRKVKYSNQNSFFLPSHLLPSERETTEKLFLVVFNI